MAHSYAPPHILVHTDALGFRYEPEVSSYKTLCRALDLRLSPARLLACGWKFRFIGTVPPFTKLGTHRTTLTTGLTTNKFLGFDCEIGFKVP